MTRKHFVSVIKFKKLYFYKFLFVQIWYGFSLIELLIFSYALPKEFTKSLLNSNMVYFIFVPMGISGILWLCSLGWYNIKLSVRRNAFIIKKGENLVFQTVRQRWQFYSPVPQYDCYTYTVKDISNINKGKYSIIVYSNITMKRCHLFEPKTILETKQYFHVKIPNIFEDTFDEDMRL